MHVRKLPYWYVSISDRSWSVSTFCPFLLSLLHTEPACHHKTCRRCHGPRRLQAPHGVMASLVHASDRPCVDCRSPFMSMLHSRRSTQRTQSRMGNVFSKAEQTLPPGEEPAENGNAQGTTAGQHSRLRGLSCRGGCCQSPACRHASICRHLAALTKSLSCSPLAHCRAGPSLRATQHDFDSACPSASELLRLCALGSLKASCKLSAAWSRPSQHLQQRPYPALLDCIMQVGRCRILP